VNNLASAVPLLASRLRVLASDFTLIVVDWLPFDSSTWGFGRKFEAADRGARKLDCSYPQPFTESKDSPIA
jgi:hypothetical protein